MKIIYEKLEAAGKSTTIVIVFNVLNMCYKSLLALRLIFRRSFAAEYLGIGVLNHLSALLNYELAGNHKLDLVLRDEL